MWGRVERCAGAGGGTTGWEQRAGSLPAEPEPGRGSQTQRAAGEQPERSGWKGWGEGEPSQRAVKGGGTRSPGAELTPVPPPSLPGPTLRPWACHALRPWLCLQRHGDSRDTPICPPPAPGTREGVCLCFRCSPPEASAVWAASAVWGGRQVGLPHPRPPGAWAGTQGPPVSPARPPFTPPGLGTVHIISGTLSFGQGSSS